MKGYLKRFYRSTVIIMAMLLIRGMPEVSFAEEADGNGFGQIDIHIYAANEEYSSSHEVFLNEGDLVPVILTVIDEKYGISSVYCSVTNDDLKYDYYTVVREPDEKETHPDADIDISDAESSDITGWNCGEDKDGSVIMMTRTLLSDAQEYLKVELSFIDEKGNYYSYTKEYSVHRDKTGGQDEDQQEEPIAPEEVGQTDSPEPEGEEPCDIPEPEGEEPCEAPEPEKDEQYIIMEPAEE